MKSTRAIIVRILLSGLLLGPFSAFAGDVVLQIAFVDGIAFHTSEVEETEAILKRQWPNARVESVSVGTARMGNLLGDGRVRRRIIAKLKALKLAPEDRIKMLVIGTHGSSDIEKDTTKLSIIGEISSRSVDAKFVEFFEPIRANMATDAQVVLNACSTMCGTNDQAAARAKTLLVALGAPQGSLYGAHTTQAAIGLHLRPSLKEAFIYVMSTLGIVEVQFIAESVVDPHFAPALMGSKMSALLWMANRTFIYGGLIYAMSKVGVPMVYASAAAQLKVNYGRLFQFNNGRTEEVREISWAFKREELLSPRKVCAKILAQAAGE